MVQGRMIVDLSSPRSAHRHRAQGGRPMSHAPRDARGGARRTRWPEAGQGKWPKRSRTIPRSVRPCCPACGSARIVGIAAGRDAARRAHAQLNRAGSVGVATFYYDVQPAARGTSPPAVYASLIMSCSLMGADRLFKHLEHKLGIDRSETTADGQFTSATRQCTSPRCGSGPKYRWVSTTTRDLDEKPRSMYSRRSSSEPAACCCSGLSTRQPDRIRTPPQAGQLRVARGRIFSHKTPDEVHRDRSPPDFAAAVGRLPDRSLGFVPGLRRSPVHRIATPTSPSRARSRIAS